MIELSPATAIMVYLCLTLAVLLGIWGFYHFSGRRKKIVITQSELFICEYCQFVYLDKISKHLTQCPQCLSFNKYKTENKH